MHLIILILLISFVLSDTPSNYFRKSSVAKDAHGDKYFPKHSKQQQVQIVHPVQDIEPDDLEATIWADKLPQYTNYHIIDDKLQQRTKDAMQTATFAENWPKFKDKEKEVFSQIKTEHVTTTENGGSIFYGILSPLAFAILLAVFMFFIRDYPHYLHMKRNFPTLQARNLDLQRSNKHLEETVANLKSQLTAALGSLKDSCKSSQDLQKTIGEQNNTESHLRSRLSQTKRFLNISREKIRKMEEDFMKKEEKFGLQKETFKDLQRINEQQKELNKKLEDRVENLKEKLEIIFFQKMYLESKSRLLFEALNKTQSDREDDLRNQLACIQGQLHTAEDKNDEMKQELTKTKSELEEEKKLKQSVVIETLDNQLAANKKHLEIQCEDSVKDKMKIATLMRKLQHRQNLLKRTQQNIGLDILYHI